MNTIIINKIPYKYESYWRSNIKDRTLDSNNKLLPFPKHINDDDLDWEDKETFLEILKGVQYKLQQNSNFTLYDKKDTFNRDCLLCDKKYITNGLFSVNNIRWENGLKHYIKKHNHKPSEEFIDFIYRYSNSTKTKEKVIGRISGKKIVKSDKKYLKVDRNQILIMDALMSHGGQKIYLQRDKNNKEKKKQEYKYSEHSGLLDFDNNGLEKIIISGNTTRVSKGDDDIYLPKNMEDALDYEYIFHTHPPTPSPGARAKDGILYEFPSMSDIFHFIDHYNDGRTQGSIIIAPEGMYIIRKNKTDDKKLELDEDKLYDDFLDMMWKCQKSAIKKYGVDFSLNTFYSKISQNKSYIKKLNDILNKYKLHIDYYSRVKDDKNLWIIDTVYLPVYSVEYK